jgi:3-dehydroquinate dehydratase II
MKKKILILNGPNLNLLHKRDKEIYGDISLSKIEADCDRLAIELGLHVDFRQSNDEGELVSFIQDAIDDFDGIIMLWKCSISQKSNCTFPTFSNAKNSAEILF